MPSPIRSIVIALAGSVAIIVVTLVFVIALWQPSSMDRFLPAAETLLFLRNAGTEDLEHFAAQYPLLSTIPVTNLPTDVALVKNGGTVVWIIAVKPGQASQSNTRVGRHEFLVADPGIGDLLTTTTPRLREAKQFQTLMHVPATTSFYIASGGTFSPALQQLLQSSGMPVTSGPLAIHRTPEGVVISVLRDPAATALRSLSTPSPVLDDAALTVSTGDLQAWMERTLALSNPEEQVRLRARLQSIIDTLSRSSISLRYDLLPILEGETTLALAFGSGTSLQYLLKSAAVNRDTRALLDRLHAEAQNDLTGTTVEEHVFEEGITARLLRSDPTRIEDTQTVINGWQMRLTGVRDGPLRIGSALRGGRVILTNNRTWLQDITGSGSVSLPAPAIQGRVLLSGSMNAETLRKLFPAPISNTETLLFQQEQNPRTYGFWLRDDGNALHLAVLPDAK